MAEFDDPSVYPSDSDDYTKLYHMITLLSNRVIEVAEQNEKLENIVVDSLAHIRELEGQIAKTNKDAIESTLKVIESARQTRDFDGRLAKLEKKLRKTKLYLEDCLAVTDKFDTVIKAHEKRMDSTEDNLRCLRATSSHSV